MNKRASAWLTLTILAALMSATNSAFMPAIHEDISAEALRATSRTIDGEDLRFSDKAILEIRRANRQTDLSSDFFRSYKHFDSETFAQASGHLTQLRDQIISAITASSPDGERGRALLGTALHTVQDFYAHSNWVEIGRSGVNSALGRSPLANPAATDAFCPASPQRLGGIGLTSETTGYYVGLLGCGPVAAGKCYHGGPGGCDGINKDEPGRPNHGAARSTAQQATRDYINQILDASGVAGNAKAIKALMGINGTLGMVVDDTGSMGGDINQVKNQVATIVGSVRNAAKAPDEYLLVRFGDPDVGPPFTTTDPDAYLAQVLRLSASGGGDCPELSQTALLQAVGASRSDSNLYLFTDASAKDSGLAGAVSAAAQRKRIKITALLTGSCSPIDPAYFRNTAETGGQLFQLQRFELGNVFDLIRPQLSGDFVTIVRTRGTFSAGVTETIPVPVDATVSRVVFSVTMDVKGATSITAPNGIALVPGQPGVTFTELTAGVLITVDAPEPGLWRLATTGIGEFAIAAQANASIDFALFEFVELTNPVHPGLGPIAGQPVTGTAMGRANVLGDATTATFELMSEQGASLGAIGLARGAANAAEDEFVGNVTLPGVPFRISVSGRDRQGFAFQRLFPTLFRAQSVRVRPDPAFQLEALPVGTATRVRFFADNLGAAGTFVVDAADSQGFVQGVSPRTLTLGAGESAPFDVDLVVPAAVPAGVETLISTTVTSSADANVTNSATLVLLTGDANRPPVCQVAPGFASDVWPPDHRLVDIPVAAAIAATDPDGDSVSFVVTAITQDEPVLGPGSGNTSPDATGVGGQVASVRAERAGGGNGRVYRIAYEGSDNRGATCTGTFDVRVPHSQNGRAPGDDGQVHDSTASVRVK
jgi:von Willebrand factor A domain-containing protein 7